MYTDHHTFLSKRMYEEHFRKWKLSKYLNQSKRDEILNYVMRDVQKQSPQPNPDISSNDLRNFLRYLTRGHTADGSTAELQPKTPGTSKSGTPCSSSTSEEIEQRVSYTELNSREQFATGESPTFSHCQYASTPKSNGNASLNRLEQLVASDDCYYTAHAPVPANGRASPILHCIECRPM